MWEVQKPQVFGRVWDRVPTSSPPPQALRIVVFHHDVCLLAPAERNAFAAEQRVAAGQIAKLKRFTCLIFKRLLLRQICDACGFLRALGHRQCMIRLASPAFRMRQQKPRAQDAQTMKLLDGNPFRQHPERIACGVQPLRCERA